MLTEKEIQEIVWRNEPATMSKLIKLIQSDLLREKISLLEGIHESDGQVKLIYRKIAELEKELKELE